MPEETTFDTDALNELDALLKKEETVSVSAGAKYVRKLIDEDLTFLTYDGNVKTIIKSAKDYVKEQALAVVIGKDKDGKTIAVNLNKVPEEQHKDLRKRLGLRAPNA